MPTAPRRFASDVQATQTRRHGEDKTTKRDATKHESTKTLFLASANEPSRDQFAPFVSWSFVCCSSPCLCASVAGLSGVGKQKRDDFQDIQASATGTRAREAGPG